MNILLDTHIVVWSALEPENLFDRFKEALEDESTMLHVSAITAWEILILNEKSQIDLHAEQPAKWISKVYKETPITVLTINHEVAIQSRLIDLPQKDPADRFIGATAKVFDMPLITVDTLFKKSKEIRIFDQLVT